jgi:glycine betaine/proline transport system substrate-binding protein
MTHRPRWWSLTILTVLLAVLAAACSDVDEGSNDGGTTGSDGGATTADCGSDTVNIAVNPWTGSAVNANVAKVIMEQELGCTVELTDIDEFAQFPALSTGDLDATLEVWPSGHAKDYKKYIDGGQGVIDGGELGVIGKIGWYIPTYMLDEHPELATWEGLNANADLFATAETSPKGQMLDGDPSFTSYDAEIVENLGLNYEVVVAGTETAELAQLKKAYAAQEPLLFYFYTPHWANQKYDLTAVELPAYTEECGQAAADETGGYACEYPEDVLYKAFNEDLQTKAPAAFDFLSAMSYDNAAQESIALDIDVEGMDPADAAQKWVDANPDVWQAWLPAS